MFYIMKNQGMQDIFQNIPQDVKFAKYFCQYQYMS